MKWWNKLKQKILYEYTVFINRAYLKSSVQAMVSEQKGEHDLELRKDEINLLAKEMASDKNVHEDIEQVIKTAILQKGEYYGLEWE